MKPLKHLTNGPLLALKTALDGYQRYEKGQPDVALYFKRIMDALVGPLDEDVNLWAIRNMINREDERRTRQITVRAVTRTVDSNLGELGPQELKILKLIGEGHRAEEIAELLGIAYQTVFNHKSHIAKKLGMGSSKDLVKFAIDNLSFM